jgi:hypothetical protein
VGLGLLATINPISHSRTKGEEFRFDNPPILV